MIHQQVMNIQTLGRGMVDVTANVSMFVSQSRTNTGICHLFLHHTSASLVLCENADSDVQHDLENFMSRLVVDGDPLFQHNMEGPDDMPAHIRTILTQNSLSIPITDTRLSLGRWQGIFIWEHRQSGHVRKLTMTLQGSST